MGRATGRWAGSACWARPGWTMPGPCRRWRRWPATSGRSSARTARATTPGRRDNPGIGDSSARPSPGTRRTLAAGAAQRAVRVEAVQDRRADLAEHADLLRGEPVEEVLADRLHVAGGGGDHHLPP